jgi:DegV family protein with EDD domain
MAARELAGEYKIIVFDSLAGSAAQAFLAREARKMDLNGGSLPEIIDRLEWIRQRIAIIFTIDTLEYAYLSGRINALQSMISTALQLKPIIVLRDGLLDVADKVRTRQRSLDHVLHKMHDRFENCPVNIAVVHAADPQTAQALLKQAKGVFNVKEAILTELSIPVAANLGPGAIGLVAYPMEEER